MRLSRFAVAVALVLPGCGRAALDVSETGDAAESGAAEPSVDAAVDVGVGRPDAAVTEAGVNATTDPGRDAATDGGIDAEADAEAEADADAEAEADADADAEADADADADAEAEAEADADAASDAAADSSPEADVRDANPVVCAWGGFAPEVTYTSSPGSIHPTYVAIADFDRDGHPDLVTTTAGPDANIYINHGDGSFAPPVTYAIGAWTNTVVTGDFNGDGWIDVAAANGLPGCGSRCCETGCDTTVAVLINRGDGTFAPAAFYDSGGTFASGLAAGDMNGDHHIDLVVANHNSNTFAVILGHGDGTFAAPVTYPATYPDTIAVADLDANGTLDVLVGLRSLYPSSIETFFNDGTGALTMGATYDYGTEQTGGYYTASSIVVGDFDGAKGVDVVVSDTFFGDVVLYPNSGNGVLGTATSFDSLGRPGFLVAADFNGDGKGDVATTTSLVPTDGGGPVGRAVVLLGDGHGGLSSPMAYESFTPWDITAADLDGDGYPDLVTGNSSGVGVLLSRCGGDAGDAAP